MAADIILGLGYAFGGLYFLGLAIVCWMGIRDMLRHHKYHKLLGLPRGDQASKCRECRDEQRAKAIGWWWHLWWLEKRKRLLSQEFSEEGEEAEQRI